MTETHWKQWKSHDFISNKYFRWLIVIFLCSIISAFLILIERGSNSIFFLLSSFGIGIIGGLTVIYSVLVKEMKIEIFGLLLIIASISGIGVTFFLLILSYLIYRFLILYVSTKNSEYVIVPKSHKHNVYFLRRKMVIFLKKRGYQIKLIFPSYPGIHMPKHNARIVIKPDSKSYQLLLQSPIKHKENFKTIISNFLKNRSSNISDVNISDTMKQDFDRYTFSDWKDGTLNRPLFLKMQLFFIFYILISLIFSGNYLFFNSTIIDRYHVLIPFFTLLFIFFIDYKESNDYLLCILFLVIIIHPLIGLIISIIWLFFLGLTLTSFIEWIEMKNRGESIEVMKTITKGNEDIIRIREQFEKEMNKNNLCFKHGLISYKYVVVMDGFKGTILFQKMKDRITISIVSENYYDKSRTRLKKIIIAALNNLKQNNIH